MLDIVTMTQLALPVTRTKLASALRVGDVVFADHWTGDDYIIDPDGFVTVGTWVRVLATPDHAHPYSHLVKPFRHLSDSFPYFETFHGTVPWRPAVLTYKLPAPRCDCNTSVMCCSRNDCKLHGGTTTPFAEGLVVGCVCPWTPTEPPSRIARGHQLSPPPACGLDTN